MGTHNLSLLNESSHKSPHIDFAPSNKAGCNTVKEAVKSALMAREVFATDLIKLEVIGDDVNLQPDPFGLVEAATELVLLLRTATSFVFCRIRTLELPRVLMGEVGP